MLERISKQDAPVRHELTHLCFPAETGDLGRWVEEVRVRQDKDGGVP